MTIKKRPKVSVYIATSIDGYIAREDGNLDWLHAMHLSGEDYGYQAFFNSIDALVLGRKTFETASSVADWPYPEKRVIVLSRTLTTIRSEAELFSGDLLDLVSKLYADGIQHVWVDGGVTISQFLQQTMVDQMILSIIPIVLGSGIPLFPKMIQELPCRFVSSQSYPSGLVQLTYISKKL